LSGPSIVVAIEAKLAISYVGEMPDNVKSALIGALNRTADRTRTRADRKIREEVAFPASYLRPSEGRLVVSQKARAESLQAVVTGRGRPTSLARFAVGSKPRSGDKLGSVSVTVKPGQKADISRAWIISLPGAPDSKNLGLAVRTEGGPPRGAYAPKQLKAFGPNVWLLYGPSVNQVLFSARNNGGVVEEITPDVIADLEAEFGRLIDLKDRVK
jgi:hypothetical protein